MVKPLKKIGNAFYHRDNVVEIAKDLIGKVLVTNWDGNYTSGRIVETEAYNGEADKASHAFNGRRTQRTEIMYGPAGSAYVYLCYGIHHLFNIVTNAKNIPHAILIRALEPMEGTDIMLKRTGKPKVDHSLTRGPGNVAKALGLLTIHSGHRLSGNELYVADDGFRVPPGKILATPRIGVDYAGEDAALPYRFILENNNFISGKKSQNRSIVN